MSLEQLLVFFDARLVSDDRYGCHAEKETMFDDACAVIQFIREGVWIGDQAKLRVDDQITFVGAERFTRVVLVFPYRSVIAQ